MKLTELFDIERITITAQVTAFINKPNFNAEYWTKPVEHDGMMWKIDQIDWNSSGRPNEATINLSRIA